MKTHYSIFFDVSDWIVLDKKILNMYNDDEIPFAAVKVKIGVYTEESVNLHNQHTQKDFDIIRWIPESEYSRLRANEGTIIW